MAAEKGLGVQRDFNVRGVGDRVADQNQVGNRWLPFPIALIHTDMT